MMTTGWISGKLARDIASSNILLKSKDKKIR